MRRLTRTRRPTCEKIEGSSPAPCPSTLWGKQVHDIHPVMSQLQKLTGSATDSQTRAFASCAWPLLSARSLWACLCTVPHTASLDVLPHSQSTSPTGANGGGAFSATPLSSIAV